jgi:uncharacterized protein YraI
MVNWESLKPLRTHRTIMTFVIIALVVIFFLPNHISNLNWKNNTQSKVIAKSGLKIRTAPNLNSDVLITLPFNETIEVVNGNEKLDIVHGENGIWCKVQYNNLEGYAWSKFISKY